MKEERSVSSKVIEKIIRLSNVKNKTNTKEKFKKQINKAMKKNSKPYQFPKLLKLKAKIVKEQIESMDYYIINQKESEKNVVLYMHGGCYVNQPVYFHWKFIEQLAVNTDYTIYVPIYPKAPNCTYVECYDKVLKLYLKIIDSDDSGKDKNIAFMGDSAGGGFVLAFAQYLRGLGIRNANNVVMISPWLDMSLENPDLKALESIDPSLETFGIVEMAKTWAGGSTFDNYMLSPIKGTFENLGKLTIFIGTHEILLPDARELRDKLTSAGIECNYYEYPYMNHVFPLFPIIPEAKKARKTIYKILNDAKQ